MYASGRWDLVLFKIVAVVNINNVPPVAVYGWASLALWLLAFATFFVPEAVAVVILSRRYPGEGGIYLWTRKQFGDAHGFLSGWCYWTNNLFYVPVLLVYMAGILAFAGGEARGLSPFADTVGRLATLERRPSRRRARRACLPAFKRSRPRPTRTLPASRSRARRPRMPGFNHLTGDPTGRKLSAKIVERLARHHDHGCLQFVKRFGERVPVLDARFVP